MELRRAVLVEGGHLRADAHAHGDQFRRGEVAEAISRRGARRRARNGKSRWIWGDEGYSIAHIAHAALIASGTWRVMSLVPTRLTGTSSAWVPLLGGLPTRKRRWSPTRVALMGRLWVSCFSDGVGIASPPDEPIRPPRLKRGTG
jgi:hypothetical protein